jgi:drug/metabolite transporter (DMT)-like permease
MARLRLLSGSETTPLHEHLAVSAVLLGVVLGSGNLICVKAAFNHGFLPVDFGVLRFLSIGCTAVLLLWLRGHPLRPREPEARTWLIREALVKTVGAGLIYGAIVRLPAAAVLILGFTHPIMQMLLAGPFLQDRVPGMRALGMGVGTIAMLAYALLLDTGASTTQGGAALGISLCLAGTALVSFMGVCTKRATRLGAHPLHSVAYTGILPGLLWVPVACWQTGFPAHLPKSPVAWGLFVYAWSLGGVLLFSYRRWLLSHYRVSFLASFSPISRVLGLLLAPLLLGETLPWKALGVLGVVLLGGALSGRASSGERID